MTTTSLDQQIATMNVRIAEENVATLSLKVAFPEGSTVTMTATDHRRVTRSGKSLTTLLVLASFDGKVSNVSGWVASALELPRTSIYTLDGESTRVQITGFGNPHAAAGVVLTQLAELLYGNENALDIHIV